MPLTEDTLKYYKDLCDTEKNHSWKNAGILVPMITMQDFIGEIELLRDGWISVHVKLPEKEVYVTTLEDDGDVRGDMICFNGGWLSGNNVTHWKPDLPEEE